MKPPFEWDQFSDQPKIIADKALKRRMRQRYFFEYLKMAGVASVALPIALARTGFLKPVTPRVSPRDFVGMGVNPDKGPQQFDLIDELGIKHVLMRMPLWDIEKLSAYQAFAGEFRKRGKTVLINVLQDREHIENPGLLATDLAKIFETFSSLSQEFQIGNATNRFKWGFYSPLEYLDFFKISQRIRDESFPQLKLIGPSVIDFEYHFTARALFNRYNVQFDRLSALLYVDRKGAPDDYQYKFFDTKKKIRFLYSLAELSPKVREKGIYVTEVNWPLADTAPWAPTSEKECVSESDYAAYMMRYLQIAATSGCVKRVYWHQLIAPGYGLIDNRNGVLRKTLAFWVLAQQLAQKSFESQHHLQQ